LLSISSGVMSSRFNAAIICSFNFCSVLLIFLMFVCNVYLRGNSGGGHPNYQDTVR
jgi:hypothetical protein